MHLLARVLRECGVDESTPLALISIFAATDGTEGASAFASLVARGHGGLALSLNAGVDGDACAIGYAEKSFYRAAVEQVVERFRVLLAAMVADDRRRIGEFPILADSERKQLLVEFNDTASPYPSERCIHELFEEQVRRSPSAVAVVQGDVELTYAQLNAHANRLARRLIAAGVRPDARVAICADRRVHLVVGLLGILKAGGAYVPLDPSYPGERLAELLVDAEPALLLVDAVGAQALGDAAASIPTIALDEPLDASLDASDVRISGLTSSHLAYVIYTSGSTGKPKGAQNEHRAVVNRLVWMQNAYALSADDVVLQKTPFSFDVSVWEFFWTLLYGAKLVLAEPGAHKDPQALVDVIRRTRVTTLHFVPSMLSSFLEHAGVERCDSLQRVICSGEALPAQSVRRHQQKLPSAQLHNLYGPTEAAVDVTAWTCPPHFDDSIVPIGRPIANTQIYLLDRHGQPVPLGAVGELHIGGDGVARGYWNRTQLTAERFVEDPFADRPNARLYRTGDLARYRIDGSIEFLGRRDHQVKLRGFRIELGEIEARLAEHASLSEAVVIAREDVPGDMRLVAYVTVRREIDIADLRAHLSRQLPDYMVPSAFVVLDALPLSSNGKLDRKALPKPDAQAVAARAYAAPHGAIEQTLATIWADMLGVERVGRNDSFFDLGGHSLLAMRLLSRLQSALGVVLTPTTMYANPTVSMLAEAIARPAAPSLPAISKTSRDVPLPPSFAQQRLWFLSQIEGNSAAYHVPFAMRLTGPLDRAALKRSLDRLLTRHEALRTVFALRDGQPQIDLQSIDRGFDLVEHDLQRAPDASVLLEQWRNEEVRAPFDLARGPLIRARLIRLAPEEHVFLLTQHHIVSDGWSVGVLFNELGALYRAFAAGADDPLPPLAIQYPDYAVWQREWLSGERLQSQVDYWRTQLADAPVLLELPTDRPRPPAQSFAGATVDVVLDAELTQALKRLSQQHGTTLFMTLLAAWAAVLSRLSGQDDVVIGTPTAGRNRQELEPLIGFFVNTLALRVDLADEPSVAQLLARVRATALAAQDHQDLPFEQVVETVQPPRRLAHTPLFQVMFAWENNEEGILDLPGLKVEPVDAPLDTAKFDVSLYLSESGDTIVGGLSYATALFDASTIERHREYLLTLLHAMTADSTQSVARIDLLSPGERELLVHGWNRTESPYPSERCIHELFEEQVRKSPSAVAVVQGDVELTYAQLNAHANRLARRLIAAGVRPGDFVAVVLARSAALIAAQLAILKAGAAYAPVDPQFPAARRAWQIADCEAKIVIADDEQTVDGVRTIAVDAVDAVDASACAADDDVNPSVAISSRDAAYVMYTSGSTGTPKGVVVPHRAVNRLVIDNGYAHFLPSDRVAFASNPSFDASTLEVWAPLLNGGRCVVVDQSTLLTPERFRTLLQTTGVDVMWLTVGLFNQIEASLGPVFRQLRILMIGGDALDPKVVANMLRNNAPGRLLNGYGPTETTTFAATYEIAECDGKTPLPIGRPIANTQIYLLDRYGQPVSLGAVGELYIGGAGVARGYLNRPELTAERFVEDPFGGDSDGRLYRTGDLARYRADGIIEFLGRRDHQVKLRGFRVELGEIEARLAEHARVRESVVLAREDAPGDVRLVAYVLARGEIEVMELRAHLAQQLPQYMVPGAFVVLDAFPLNANGKLDRNALPKPDSQAVAARAYAAPQGAIEQALAAIWSGMLGIEHVGRNDSFFELGGHSLLAMRLIARMRADFRVEVPVSALFEKSRLFALADFVLSLQVESFLDKDMSAMREELNSLSEDELRAILAEGDTDE